MYLLDIFLNTFGKITPIIFLLRKLGRLLRRYLLPLSVPLIETNINKSSLSLTILSQSAWLETGLIYVVWSFILLLGGSIPFISIFWLLFRSFRHFLEITSITMRFLLVAATIGVTFSYPNGRFLIWFVIWRMFEKINEKRIKVSIDMIRLSSMLSPSMYLI